MQNHFLEFIKKHALIIEKDKVLLAVSGGIDSVVMAHLFKQSKIEFGIAHCNFQLRGKESEEDANFVGQLADKLGVEFHLKTFNTIEFAKERGISTQMAARELRYQWFEKLMEGFAYQKIASAHHKNDNVETLVHNLTRGTSISGLRGMLPISGKLIRPLLDITRNQIEDFAKEYEIRWREDASNKSVTYKRNFIRHEVLPKFEELNPNYLEVIASSMAKNGEVEQVFKHHIETLQELLLIDQTDGSIRISIEELKNRKVGPYVFSELIKNYGLNYDDCILIVNKLDNNVGKQFNGKGFVLTIDRNDLFINPISNSELKQGKVTLNTEEDFLDNQLTIKKFENRHVVDGDENKAFLDLDKLKFPLILRTWKKGDSFRPLGMKGKKKLSDFMIDAKIPLNLKKEQEVILSDEDIVWVVGKRIDDRYKVTDSTQNIFMITRTDANV